MKNVTLSNLNLSLTDADFIIIACPLNKQTQYLIQKEPNVLQSVQKTKVNNSCFWREYYLGSDSPINRAISAIIDQAINRPFFTEMRTNQQLGYIVWSGSQRRDVSQYLYFIIQSGVYSADELNKRADEYGYVKSSAQIILRKISNV